MTDYKNLVEALRHCSEADDACATCQRWLANDEWGIKCKGRLISDAADAIETLQAEVEELKAKKMKLAENSLRFVGKVRELDKRRFEPKRGKWKVDMSHFSPHIVCSVCGVEIPCVAGWCMDAHMNYCPNCGAKMEVQDGQE